MAPASRRSRQVDWARSVRDDQQMGDRVLWTLIGINVVVFVLWSQSRGSLLQDLMARHFLVSVDSIAELRFWTLITAEFSHYEPNHLLFNMLGLYFFGRPVAQALGWKDLLGMYMTGALVASLAHVLYGIVTGDMAPSLGASGAVMAIGVCFAALYPRATLLVSFVFPVPAAVAVGGYLLLDVFGVLGGGGNVAHAAHLGGALVGLVWWYVRTRR
ncbi:MAG: rhomboid family intramembrane serine protease [Myxococcales bacterium]|nr:rhomboid family intramembrane serine protease [Myxococcales bacterium]